MPKSLTRWAFVETATKWLATAFSPSVSTSQSLAACALASVSCVPNVLDATMKSVVSGLSVASVSAKCEESTFETKWVRTLLTHHGRKASVVITGPRSDPPMPILTTCSIFLPVDPCHDPSCIESQKVFMRASTSRTSGMTSMPSTCIGRSDWFRSATCITARCSVVLMGSPANMASRMPVTFRSAANPSSKSNVFSVARCLLRSTTSSSTV